MDKYFYKVYVDAKKMTYGDYCKNICGVPHSAVNNIQSDEIGYCVMSNNYPDWYPVDSFELLFFKDEEKE